jgi:protein-S-isoprenylcysteine O-methyltransferase Ste14
MNPWYAKAVVLVASVALIVIRAPHGQRSRSIEIAKDKKGVLEVVLLSIAMPGFFVPLVWICTSWFSFADYPLRPVPFTVGVIGYVVGLWLFHRSHADLGTNWSVTLQIRNQHRLVTEGIYRRIRHPMYLALFLYSIGQVLVLPNWLAGPSYLVTFGILFVLRLQAEERMMLEEFGDDYASYMKRTKRLVPGLW